MSDEKHTGIWRFSNDELDVNRKIIAWREQSEQVQRDIKIRLDRRLNEGRK